MAQKPTDASAASTPEDEDTQRCRRLRAAQRAGAAAPADLVPWLVQLARDRYGELPAEEMPLSRRLAAQVAAETVRWMRLRGVTCRTIGMNRSAVERCRLGENVTLATVDDLAAGLNCDVILQFRERDKVKSDASPSS